MEFTAREGRSIEGISIALERETLIPGEAYRNWSLLDKSAGLPAERRLAWGRLARGSVANDGSGLRR